MFGGYSFESWPVSHSPKIAGTNGKLSYYRAAMLINRSSSHQAVIIHSACSLVMHTLK
jgi:hypothetical protein